MFLCIHANIPRLSNKKNKRIHMCICVLPCLSFFLPFSPLSPLLLFPLLSLLLLLHACARAFLCMLRVWVYMCASVRMRVYIYNVYIYKTQIKWMLYITVNFLERWWRRWRIHLAARFRSIMRSSGMIEWVVTNGTALCETWKYQKKKTYCWITRTLHMYIMQWS